MRHLPENWVALEREDQIDELIEKSWEKPQIVFKHSTRCGVSHHALEKLTYSWDIPVEALDFHFLDLLAYRPVSNAVSKKLNVLHQSPQLILIKNGEAAEIYTHHAINLDKVKKMLS